MLVLETLGFFRCILQNALRVLAQRQVNRSRNLFPNLCAALYLFPNGFDGGVRAEKAIGDLLVFAQEAQQ